MAINEIKIGNTRHPIEDTTAREHLVEVGSTQPVSEANKLWIKNQEQEYEVPTMTEFNNLKSAINSFDGGTIGQYLRKKSGTDFDVEWAPVEGPSSVDFSIVTKIFPTVADMVADTMLESGDNVATRGYFASGDNGGFNYVVSSTHTGVFYITLSNGLYANRLTEDKCLIADTIGIRAYSTKATALENTTTATSNQTIAQAAINAGFSLKFGRGYYAFDNYLQIRNSTTIEGIYRNYTNLLFPSSIGLNFNLETEYNSQYFKEFKMEAYGNCINVTDDVRTMMNCSFSRMWLVSETGECIVGPLYNRGSLVIPGYERHDTCIWSCQFTHIRAESKTGAMVANIMGLGNWFYDFLMLGDTTIAFRNCDGTFARMDTGCSDPQYCFYYDAADSYTLSLTLFDIHFEGCSKSFIYTTDETAATMSIGIYAFDSGVSNIRIHNSDVPFIKVGTLRSIHKYGKYSLLPAESNFDMEALHGAIIHFKAFNSSREMNEFKTNMGGTSGLKMYQRDAGTIYYAYGGEGGITQLKWSPNYTNLIPKHGIYSAGIFIGGRNKQKFTLSYSDLPAATGSGVRNINIKTIDPLSEYCDCLQFDLADAQAKVVIRQLKLAEGESFPGRVLTIINNSTSAQNLEFEPGFGSGDYCLIAASSAVTLAPGDTIVFYLGYEGTKLRWYPIKQYELPDASSSVKGGVMIEDTPTQNSTKAITSGGVYTAIANLKTIDFHICTNGEYNTTTGVPTIQDPDPNTFYLVPNGEQTGNDLFVEWVYKNNAWEIFGSAKIDLSGYVQKTDIDSAPTSGSDDPVSSGGVYTALSGKQGTLTFDSAPTENSVNPVTSGGVYTALAGKQGTLTFDSTPTENSENPVTSGGLYTALAGKQTTLTFDSVPTTSSSNPVTSGGVKTAIDTLGSQVVKIDANGCFYVD